MAVYLLHFDQPYRHARHYMGYSRRVNERVAEHRESPRARLMQVIKEAGIGFVVARVWSKGTRSDERRMKNNKCAPAYCPICKARKKESGQ